MSKTRIYQCKECGKQQYLEFSGSAPTLYCDCLPSGKTVMGRVRDVVGK